MMKRFLISLIVTLVFIAGVKAQTCAPPKDSLFVWLKADAFCLANNATIGTWDDSSGRGNSLAAGGAPPVFKTNIVNSLPAIYFDGSHYTGTWLAGNGALNSLTEGELFIVVKIDTDPPATTGVTGLWDFTSHSGANCTNANTHYPYTDSLIYDGAFSTVRKNVGNPSPALTSWRVYNVQSKANSWIATLDTVQLFSTGTNAFATNGGERLGTGCSSYNLQGYIAEFLLYNHVVSGADRTSIWAYLGQKYGLSYTTANYGSPPCPSCASNVGGKILD